MSRSSAGNRNSAVVVDQESSNQYYQEEFPNVISVLKNGTKSACSRSALTNRLPITKWLPDYKLIYLLRDFIAGLTVGLTAIPQGIAYGVVSGLGPQYGLYAAFMGSFTYILFGSCKDITIGPTAIMALMVQRYVDISVDFAILACFLTGAVITLFGLLHFGFLVQFISAPVTNGFTTAAAITIASGQINALLGIPSKSNDFVAIWVNVFTKIDQTRFTDLGLGLGTIVFLILLRKCTQLTGKLKLFGKYLSLSRNALAVIIGGTLAYIFSIYDLYPFRLTGKLQAGLPPFQLPPFSTVTKNGTDLDFADMVNTLGSSIIAIPIVSILDTVAIANAFSKGKTVDASQEMVALGICNIGASFFSSMPITGSFTRTAVNSASGVMTPLGGLFTGALVLLGLGFLTETFYFIPKSVLAGIIILAMYYMVHFDKIADIWRAKRIDILPFIVTVLACLYLGLEIGILCGVALSVLFILYDTARPEVFIEARKIEGNDILLVKPSQNLVFSSAEYLKSRIIGTVSDLRSNSIFVIIDGELVKDLDSTVAMHVKTMCDDLKLLNCEVVFWNWKRKTAGVLWRLSQDFEKHFSSGSSYNEIIKKMVQGKSGDEAHTQTFYFPN